MKIYIHRGSNEIGGTCIQLSTATTTILLDIGQPLSKTGGEINLTGIKIDGVLVSHPHMDHFGLINTLNKETPVWLGEVGKSFIEATRMLLGEQLPDNNFHYFTKWKPFTIGDIKITPWC